MLASERADRSEQGMVYHATEHQEETEAAFQGEDPQVTAEAVEDSQGEARQDVDQCSVSHLG